MIDESTYNINPENTEAGITTRTRAILLVHLYGFSANMAKIMQLAVRYDLKVIEDCAQSFGAQYAADCIHCRAQECNAEIRSQIKDKFTGSIGHCGLRLPIKSENK